MPLVRTALIDALTIRPFARADVMALQDYFEALSARARGGRFMGVRKRLSAYEIEDLLAPSRTHFGLLAEVATGGGSLVVGEAQYALDRDRQTVELALSVTDRWQRKGVGSALLGALAICTARHCVRNLAGDVLRSNGSMIALARKAGFLIAPLSSDWHQVRFEKRLLTVSSRCVDGEFKPTPRAA